MWPDNSQLFFFLQLHRVSVDHLSDAFVDVFSPLNALGKAAQEGDREQVERVARAFEEHAEKMLKAINNNTDNTVFLFLLAILM